MKRYQVTAGNVGLVHEGNSKAEVEKIYRLYVTKSKHNEGRVAGESVTLFDGEEIIAEHIGTMQD